MDTDKVGFPKHNIPNDKKDFDWILKFAQAAFSHSNYNPRTMFFHNRNKYYQIKDYVMANQDINKYKPWAGVDELSNDTHMNVDWTPLGFFNRMRRQALNDLNKVGYNIKVNPLDPVAEQEKSQWYAKMMAKIELREAMEDAVKEAQMLIAGQGQQQSPTMDSVTGKIPQLKKKGDEPEDFEELQIMKSYTYKSNMASRMKKVLDLILYMNDIDNIRREVREAVFDYGVAVLHDYIDSNGAIRVKSEDPMNIITNYCIKKDFSDLQFIGSLTRYTVPELRQAAQDQFSEDQYNEIEKNVVGKFPSYQFAYPPPQAYNYFYDQNNVIVLDLEFKSYNYLYSEMRVNKNGNMVYGRTKPNNKTSSDNAETRYIRSEYEVWYRCKWLVGTGYMFDFGLCTNMKRAKNSLQNAKSNFHIYSPDFYNYQATSRSALAIPYIDNAMMNWYKFQNELNRTIPNGWRIDLDALENIPWGKGGEELGPQDVLDMFFPSGVLVYRSTNLRGQQQNTLPVEKLEGGLNADVLNYFKIMAEDVNMLMNTLGVRPSVTDTARKNQQGLQMEYEANITALSDIIETDKWLLERTCDSLVLRIQDVLKVRPIEGYYTALGQTTPTMIKEGRELSNYDFGIKIQDKPSDADKARLEQIVNDAYGKQELDAQDLFIIDNMEDVSAAQQLLAYKISKYKKKIKEEQQFKIQLQMKMKQQEIMTKAQAKVMEINAEWDNKTKYIQVEKGLEAQLQDKKIQAELALAKIEQQTQIGKVQTGNMGRQQIQSMKHYAGLLQAMSSTTTKPMS